MSASKAAEMIVHHTQAASYHQGREMAYAEAMLLLRSAHQRARNLPMAEVIAMLERTEMALYDLSKEECARKDKRNAITREVSELLVAADNNIRTR